MKIVIAYESKDESVLKLVKAIEKKFSVDLIDVTKTRSANLNEYDLIGFASETEDEGFYRDIASFAANWMPRDKKIFFIYTYAVNNPEYCSELEGTAHFKNCKVVGKYGCHGNYSAGSFKLFGGKNKSHPNEDEIHGALKFFAEISGEKPAEPKEDKLKPADKTPEKSPKGKKDNK